MQKLKRELSTVLDSAILSIDFFSQGQIGDIYKVNTLEQAYILKTSQPSKRLQIEANMLEDINKYHIYIKCIMYVKILLN